MEDGATPILYPFSCVRKTRVVGAPDGGSNSGTFHTKERAFSGTGQTITLGGTTFETCLDFYLFMYLFIVFVCLTTFSIFKGPQY